MAVAIYYSNRILKYQAYQPRLAEPCQRSAPQNLKALKATSPPKSARCASSHSPGVRSGSGHGKQSNTAVTDVAALRPRGKVVIVIKTDGEDNRSTQVTKKQLARMIAAKEKIGWRFVYEGPRLVGLQEAARSAHRPR